MKNAIFPSFAAAAALAGCAARAAPPAPIPPILAPARLVADTAAPASASAPPAPVLSARPAGVPALSERPRARRRSSPALARVSAANRNALHEPIRAGYAGAVQVYPWVEGSLYRLYTAPEQVSDIALQAGEGLVSVAAGDTVRWVIGDTSSGAGASRRVHILVKPSAAGLATNLIVATDRRVYHVQLESSLGGAMASIAWTYPEDALLALRAAPSAGQVPPVAEALDVDTLNFNYAIEGDRPPWRPLRAFDDGRQVFIEFPASLAAGEAPPLFVLGEKGAAELVNYRLRGRFYVVDRLFAAAELRLGKDRQQVVRIVRSDGGRAHRARGRGK